MGEEWTFFPPLRKWNPDDEGFLSPLPQGMGSESLVEEVRVGLDALASHVRLRSFEQIVCGLDGSDKRKRRGRGEDD
jgi:hypothetical protein